MELTDASVRIIAALLAERTGQELTQARLWRIPTALGGIFRDRGIANVDQLACLLADPTDTQLADDVVEALLNNETYFFRDTSFFDALRNQILPDLAKKRANRRSLSIWSAGCSTGQEALSLAMLFAEQEQSWRGWTVNILGTDISARAVAAARRGVYSQFEIQRGTSVSQMLGFFDGSSDGWMASDLIRAMVRFRQHNLLDAPPSSARFDLVLCRNVLLYFGTANRTLAFERLDEAVARDGWLMLGAGETVVGQTDRFAPLHGRSPLFVPAAQEKPRFGRPTMPAPKPAPTARPERSARSFATFRTL